MWQGFIRTSQVYRSECQSFTRTKPVYCSKWQGLSRTMPLVSTKNESFQLTLFLVWSSSCQGQGISIKCLNSTHSRSVELGKLQGRASFYFWWSSFAEIDKRTELDWENQPLYTQIFWKVPNSMESTWRYLHFLFATGSESKSNIWTWSEWEQNEALFMFNM